MNLNKIRRHDVNVPNLHPKHTAYDGYLAHLSYTPSRMPTSKKPNSCRNGRKLQQSKENHIIDCASRLNPCVARFSLHRVLLPSYWSARIRHTYSGWGHLGAGVARLPSGRRNGAHFADVTYERLNKDYFCILRLC